MVDITSPMLAGKAKDPNKIKYPVGATPKLDGIRALRKENLVSRSFKLIANKFTRNKFEDILPTGIDGELILKGDKPCGAPFNKTSSAVMSEEGEPRVLYHAFDYVKDDLNKPYMERMDDMKETLCGYKDVVILYPVIINNEEELNAYEEKCLAEGYEGVMIRDLNGPYKCGRSTEREGYLLKIKRYEDSEAEILDFEEKRHNENEAETDVFGHTKRSSKKEGMKGANTLGKISVKDIKTGIEFGIGSGFNDELREEIWEDKDKFKGKIIKYKHQPSGKKEKPRFPVFLGFRDKNDM